MSLEYHCIELGCYTSELDAADFGKIPNPELEEIQEIESASFLSFRGVLCYKGGLMLHDLSQKCFVFLIPFIHRYFVYLSIFLYFQYKY